MRSICPTTAGGARRVTCMRPYSIRPSNPSITHTSTHSGSEGARAGASPQLLCVVPPQPSSYGRPALAAPPRRDAMAGMQPEPYDHLFKLLLIGDAGVGKSSILLRFTDDNFDEHQQSTIGVDFKVKHMDVGGKRIKMTIWDTAGQERFRTLTSSYYRGAQGIILVYDVNRRDSFENLSHWLQEVEVYGTGGGREIVKVLVGNKVDKERVVAREEAEAWARSKGMLFLEASAKTRTGIKQVFQEVVQKVLDNPHLLANTAPGRPRVSLGGAGQAPDRGAGRASAGYCC